MFKLLFFMFGLDGIDDYESRECLEGSNEDMSGMNMGNVFFWNYCIVLLWFICNNIWKMLRVFFFIIWGFLFIFFDRCVGLFVCFVFDIFVDCYFGGYEVLFNFSDNYFFLLFVLF